MQDSKSFDKSCFASSVLPVDAKDISAGSKRVLFKVAGEANFAKRNVFIIADCSTLNANDCRCFYINPSQKA